MVAGAVGAPAAPADADRRVGPATTRAGHPARGRRLRAGRAVERRLPPRGPRRPDRGDRRATTPTSSRCRRWPRCSRGASSTTARSRRSAAPTTASRSTSSGCPAWRLVVCNQNHDQVGNRARGDRLAESLDDDQLAAAALLTLAGPFTPMLFQGEEWAASTPFAFFTSHPEADLGHAVSEGRKREFEKMGWDTETILDPQDPATFAASKLDWSEVHEGRHARGAGGLPVAGGAAALPARAHRPRPDPDLVRVRRGGALVPHATWWVRRADPGPGRGRGGQLQRRRGGGPAGADPSGRTWTGAVAVAGRGHRAGRPSRRCRPTPAASCAETTSGRRTSVCGGSRSRADPDPPDKGRSDLVCRRGVVVPWTGWTRAPRGSRGGRRRGE